MKTILSGLILILTVAAVMLYVKAVVEVYKTLKNK